MKVLSTKAHIGLFLYVTTVILPVEVGGNTICSCYTIKSQGSLWQWDRKQCQKSGGDLVAMETEDEWEFIKNRIQRESTKDGDQWYIGLYRNESTGNWTWVSGKPLTIQKWRPNRPDSDPFKNVALIARNYPPGMYGLFNNVDGKKLYKAYICEETRTSDCSLPSCWIHTNRTTSTPSTIEVTPRKKLTEPVILQKQEEVASSSSSPAEHSTQGYSVENGTRGGCEINTVAIACLACVTSLLLVVNMFLLTRMRRNWKKNQKRYDEIQMTPDRVPQEVSQETAPVLYQALGENRSEPEQQVYTSLCKASRQRVAETDEDDRLLPATYENVKNARATGADDYENMPV